MFVNKVYLEFIHTHTFISIVLLALTHIFLVKTFHVLKVSKILITSQTAHPFRFKRSRELREELFVCEDKQFSEMNG